MHDAVDLEAKGIPTAVIMTTKFALEAQTQRDALGLKELNWVMIQHPLSTVTETEIGQRIDEAVPQINSIWTNGKAN